MENYSITVAIQSMPSQVFDALTKQISTWWTKDFQGSAISVGDQFTIKFGDNVAKTIEVVAITEPFNVAWLVKQALIDIPQLQNKAEWIGTKIIWTIEASENGTSLNLEHIGLNEALECFDICTAGWAQFVGSLTKLVETGQGEPYQ